jgi:hypothetical protein
MTYKVKTLIPDVVLNIALPYCTAADLVSEVLAFPLELG